MKKLASTALLIGPALCLAQLQSFPGTKKEVLSTPASNASSTTGIMPLIQMLVAMAIVFVVVKYLLPKIASRVGKKLNTKVGSGIKVEESASFGGGMLYVVEARGKSLLLSVGSQGVTCLADLTEKKEEEKPFVTFNEMLTDSKSTDGETFTPSVEVDESEDTNEEDEDKARQAVETLRRLTH